MLLYHICRIYIYILHWTLCYKFKCWLILRVENVSDLGWYVVPDCSVCVAFACILLMFFLLLLFFLILGLLVVFQVLNGRLWFIFFLFFSYDFHIKVIFHLVMQFPPIHFLPVLGKNEQHGGIIPLKGYCFNKERFRTKQQVNKEKKFFFCKIDMKVLSVCHFYWIGPLGRFSVKVVLSGCCLCVPSQKTRFTGD